jgi:hypothetical protein
VTKGGNLRVLAGDPSSALLHLVITQVFEKH